MAIFAFVFNRCSAFIIVHVQLLKWRRKCQNVDSLTWWLATVAVAVVVVVVFAYVISNGYLWLLNCFIYNV